MTENRNKKIKRQTEHTKAEIQKEKERERKGNLICYILKLQSSVKKLCSQVQKFSPSKIKFKIKIQVQIKFFIFIRSTDCTFNQNEVQIMHSWFGCSFNSFRFCSEIYSIIFEFGKLQKKVYKCNHVLRKSHILLVICTTLQLYVCVEHLYPDFLPKNIFFVQKFYIMKRIARIVEYPIV